MKIAYFDCQFGAAGDMLLASMLAAGLSQERLLGELSKIALPPGSVEVKISDTIRCSIACKKVDVSCRHEHEERHLDEIVDIIERSEINPEAMKLSKRIFERLAQAEARVHGVPVSKVHFHEVGAVDAIVDIVGFAIGYHLLEIEASYVSAVPLGSGTVKTEHGLLAIPGPAVLNLLSDAKAPIRKAEINFECLTPTGAAILCTIADEWGTPPAMAGIIATGYGAGTKNPESWPNSVRLILADKKDSAASSVRFPHENIAVIEANLDDSSPQAIAFAVERLFEAGALDVAVLPAVMKKGRSGHLLSVLCKPDDQVRLQELILAETSTLGARTYTASRMLANREWKDIALSAGGSVRIKIARDLAGRIINAQPEYEDCAAYATAHKVPLKQVVAEAIAKFENSR